MLRARPGWGATDLRRIIQGSGPSLPHLGPSPKRSPGGMGSGIEVSPPEPLGPEIRISLPDEPSRMSRAHPQPHSYIC